MYFSVRLLGQHRLTVVVVAALVLSSLLGYRTLSDRPLPGHCYRIGFESSKAYHFVDDDGGPTGLAVDLISAAARRRDVCLEWVRADDGPEQSFADDIVDLWPLVGNVVDRTDRFHITAPWRKTRFWLVSRKERPVRPDDGMEGVTIALSGGRVAAVLAQDRFPAAATQTLGGLMPALASVCRGESDAVILQDFPADVPPERPVVCDDVEFKFAAVPNAELAFGIAATYRTPGAVAAADAIRAGISDLVADATLPEMYFRWFGNTSRETYVIEKVNDAEAVARRLGTALAFLAVLVILLIWQSIRVRTARRAAEKAFEAAASASEAKSRFLSTMSHEIRTPLSGVLGMASLLEQTRLDDDQRDHVEAIRKSGEALLGIIDDVLDFSKIEAGRLELEEIDFDLPELIGSITQILSYQASRDGLRLDSELDAALPRLFRGDPARLRQVLVNLVGNAVKFTEQGGVTVKCRWGGDGNDSRVRFEISDTGPGIDSGIMPLLFRPFQQADAATTRHFGGTGLGLAISRRLVEMMGGAIGCRNNSGPGATFWVTIPLQPGTEAEECAGEQAEEGTAPIVSCRVLVVEDNAVNRTVAARMLELSGVAVDTVRNGQEAVSVAAENRYAVIFMDCRMPVMDGYEATRQIRQREAGQRCVAIVALTANAFSEDRQRCFAAGMDDYLTKPVSLDRLQATLRKWVPASEIGALDAATASDEPGRRKSTLRLLP